MPSHPTWFGWKERFQVSASVTAKILSLLMCSFLAVDLRCLLKQITLQWLIMTHSHNYVWELDRNPAWQMIYTGARRLKVQHIPTCLPVWDVYWDQPNNCVSGNMVEVLKHSLLLACRWPQDLRAVMCLDYSSSDPLCLHQTSKQVC